MSGRVVILNGAPRSGKSSIARSMQQTGAWINFGVDAAIAMTSEALRPGIGLRPGAERPELEPFVQQLYGALFGAIAAMAREGLDVVSDVGLHDSYSHPLGVLADATQRLAGLDVLFVGVRCPIDVIMVRRNADPQGGHYLAGEGVPEPVARWQEAVHIPGLYDLELDTSLLTPDACAAQIQRVLASPPTPSAFEKLARL